MFTPLISQIRQVSIKVSSFPTALAEKIGQSLERSSCLDKISLCVGKATYEEILKFQNTHLQLVSVSEEFLSTLLQLNKRLLHKVVLLTMY